MSGLEALGLACNIMQVISFVHEAVRFCKDVYQGRSPDAQLLEIARSLESLASDVQKHNQALKPQTASQKSLSDIAKKCNIAARALEEEVKFLCSHHGKGNLAATLRVAVKTNWRKSRLERLDKSLHDYQATMESHLLARIW